MNEGAKPEKTLKKELIFKAAEQLFNRYGIKRVTVEEICKTAEVSKMTFYKYFPNKMEILHHIWEGWIDEGCAILDKVDSLDISLPDKIDRMFKWKTDLLDKIGDVLLEDIMRLNLSLERSITRFFEFIINAQKRGEIRKDIKPEFLMTVLDRLYDLGNDEKLRSIYPNLLEFNREIKDFFWFGVMAGGDDR